MNVRALITSSARLTPEALHRISWDISILRGWSVEPGDGSTKYPFQLMVNGNFLFRGTAAEIEEMKPAWFSFSRWTDLFDELPLGSILSINKTDDPLQKYGVCMCNCGLPTKICQPGPTAAVAVCFAWLAWKVSAALPVPIDITNVSDQIQ